MSKLSVNDRVRVLGSHGNTVGRGVVCGFTAQDRTHVSRKIKGRPLAIVRVDGVDGLGQIPLGRLRKDG